VANQDSLNTSVLLGNGDGTFQAQAALSTQNPVSTLVADFNHDGKMDVAVGLSVGNQISLFMGNGNGTFQAPVAVAPGHQVLEMKAVDLNGDGNLDIVAAADNSAGTSPRAVVLLGNGDGTFSAPTEFATGPGNTSASIAVGDLNGDGKLDLAVANT